MEQDFMHKVQKIQAVHRRKRKKKLAIGVLISLVVLCTTYAMILLALTEEDPVYCGMVEHTHSEQCNAKKLVCTLEEAAHSDECYGEAVLVCGLEECDPHWHGEQCFAEPQLICEQAHEHEAECYAEPELICDLEETEGHAHFEECYDRPMICNHEVHTHGEECYEQIVCELPEHKHDQHCFTNLNADLESSADWESTLANVHLSGNWREDVLNIAKTQLGYAESTSNFVVGENGAQQGYTRYGQWYGSPYGDWCAMFVSFCIHYAGIEDFPLEGSCERWIEKLSAREVDAYRPVGSYEPKVGDIIFFDFNPNASEEPSADHVGLIAEILEEEILTGKRYRVLEGNSNNCVQYMTYDVDDEIIMGFGIMPDGTGDCGVLAHKHSEICYADGMIVCGKAEHSHNELCQTHDVLLYQDENLNAMVYVSADSLPENAQLTVTSEDGERVLAVSDAVQAQLDASLSVSDTLLYQFAITADGEAVELQEKAIATMQFNQAPIDSENADKSSLSIYRVSDDGKQLSLDHMKDGGYAVSEDGLSWLQFEMQDLGEVAVVLANQTISGTFYQRVNKIDSTSDRYLIVGAQGCYALTNSGATGKQVKMIPVKGNPGYFQIDGVTNAMLWKFSATVNGSGSANVQSVGNTSNYLNPAGTSLISTTARASNITYVAPAGSFRFTRTSYATTYYLTETEGSFACSDDATYTSYMLLLKQVNVQLTIPEDATEKSTGGGGSDEPETPEHYDPYIETSGEQSTEMEGVDGLTGLKIKAVSDGATSQIESLFAGIEDQAGFVVTDKSVIQGDDDYGAFTRYKDDQFSIALSALAQEFEIIIEDTEKIPVDVVLVLDTSGSMDQEVTLANGTKEKRSVTVTSATNTLIKAVMDSHPASRIGIVSFASTSGNFLPLSRYYINGSASATNYLTISGTTISTNANLYDQYSRTKRSGSLSVVGGTFTQRGIQRGLDLFNAEKTTTYVNNHGVEVIRTPILILLSDGEPTHCTNDYMDPLNGPCYGSGNSGNTNSMGVIGFYTILTANYAKSMIGIHYDKPCRFFTIGMGIEPTGTQDSSGSTAVGDHYRRAVLNPTDENIQTLTWQKDPKTGATIKNFSTTSDMLYKMLHNTYTEATNVTLTTWTGYEADIGQTTTIVPVLPNPYTAYSYANNAFFSKNFSSQQLADTFKAILEESAEEITYSSSVTDSTNLTLSDTIGKGMEIQDNPVLRVNGSNYTMSLVKEEWIADSSSGSDSQGGEADNFEDTEEDVFVNDPTQKGILRQTYRCESDVKVVMSQFGEAVPISSTYAIVETDHGIQTVTWTIPGDLVPEYAKSKQYDWYYEELPIRLFLKVGLTAEALEEAKALPIGGSVSFYTNDPEHPATAHFVPSELNPYYGKDYSPVVQYKESNPTGTQPIAYSTEVDKLPSGQTEIVSNMGNNGAISFEREETPLVDLSIVKQWRDVPEEEQIPCTFKVYKVNPEGNAATLATRIIHVTDDEGNTKVVEEEVVVTISKENNWHLTAENLPVLEDGWRYAVVEDTRNEFDPAYSHSGTVFIDGVATVASIVSAQESGDVTIRNYPAYALPETGGNGSRAIVFAGCLLLMAALLMAPVLWRKKASEHN